MGIGAIRAQRSMGEMDETRVDGAGLVPIDAVTLQVGQLKSDQRNVGPLKESVDNSPRIG
jgi:hypothetical protein